MVRQQPVAVEPTQLLQRLVLDLAHPLPADLQLLADLRQRVLVPVAQLDGSSATARDIPPSIRCNYVTLGTCLLHVLGSVCIPGLGGDKPTLLASPPALKRGTYALIEGRRKSRMGRQPRMQTDPSALGSRDAPYRPHHVTGPTVV